jgi:hypothetical protein
MLGMSVAGAAMIAATALSYETPRRVAAAHEHALVRLSAKAFRNVVTPLFRREHSPIACSHAHADA